MPMRPPGFMKTPFAATGDRVAIPDAVQADGSVSMPQGWGPDYSKDQETDPSAKPVERTVNNQILYALSQLINRWQTETFPEFIPPEDNGGVAFAYPKDAIVRYGSPAVLRRSLVDNNNTIPSSTPNAFWGDAFGGATPGGDYISKSDVATQIMQAGIAFGGPCTVPPLVRSETGSRVVNAMWATDGKAGTSNASSGLGATAAYLKFPFWMSTGGTRSFMIAWGSSRWLANPSLSYALRLVTFPLAFATVPTIFVSENGQPNTNGLGTVGVWPNQSTTQFQAVLDANATANGAGGNTIANDVPFMWLAIGVAE